MIKHFTSFPVLLQLAMLFSNVKMHRGLNNLLKKISITCAHDMEVPVEVVGKMPLTFCMAPPTNFSTFFLLTLFMNMLIIFSFLDSMDSDN